MHDSLTQIITGNPAQLGNVASSGNYINLNNYLWDSFQVNEFESLVATTAFGESYEAQQYSNVDTGMSLSDDASGSQFFSEDDYIAQQLINGYELNGSSSAVDSYNLNLF